MPPRFTVFWTLCWLSTLLIAIAISYTMRTNGWKSAASDTVVCEQPDWKFRLFSYDPFIAHIENFVAASERRHLLSLRYVRTDAAASVCRSRNALAAWTDTALPRWKMRMEAFEFRLAERALQWYSIQMTQPQCALFSEWLKSKAFISTDDIEAPQLTYYTDGQEVRAHYDWVANEEGIVTNREVTAFAILEADCTDCGTSFPALRVNWEKQGKDWCKFFDCQSSTFTTIPVPGSALFWRNTHLNGTGHQKVLHAGLPIKGNRKVGLNVFTKM